MGGFISAAMEEAVSIRLYDMPHDAG